MSSSRYHGWRATERRGFRLSSRRTTWNDRENSINYESPRERSSDLARICHSGYCAHPEVEMDSNTGEETSSNSKVSQGVQNPQDTVTFPRIASPQEVAKIPEILVANHPKQSFQAAEPLHSEVTAHEAKFQKFRNLPTEIRLMIWSLAGTFRVIETRYFASCQQWAVVSKSYEGNHLKDVNIEARGVFMKNWLLFLPLLPLDHPKKAALIPPVTYVNPIIDIVYISKETDCRALLEPEPMRLLTNHPALKNLPHIAGHCGIFSDYNSFVLDRFFSVWLLGGFELLKTITVGVIDDMHGDNKTFNPITFCTSDDYEENLCYMGRTTDKIIKDSTENFERIVQIAFGAHEVKVRCGEVLRGKKS